MQKSFLSLTCCYFVVDGFWGFFVVSLMGRGSIRGDAIPPRIPCKPQHQERMHFVMSEQPRRHGSLPGTSKQISFCPSSEFL